MKKLFTLLIVVALLFSLNPAQAALCPPWLCPPPSGPDPIILIPGIGGSWNWDVMLHGVLSDSWDFTIGTKTYQPFIEALEAEGKVEGEDFFIAFYDWRKPNYDSARDYLIPIIDEAKSVTGASKVDIVAHSMGGLVARSYIQTDLYRFDVDQVIFNGTPNHGSSDVYSIWEGGRIPKNWDKAQREILRIYLFLLTGSVREKTWYHKIHEDFKSVSEMLPVYDYVINKDDPDDPNNPKSHSLMIEQNPILGNLNNDLDLLVNNVRDVRNLVGNNQPTVKTIPTKVRSVEDEPLWVDGKPDPIDPALNDTDGDNRVLLSSAILPGISTVSIEGEHGQLLSLGGPTIFSALGLTDPGIIDLPYEPTEVLSFWFASPVQPKVIAPDTSYITKDFSSISGAEYDGEADPLGVKMIYIPDPQPGQYQVELTGTGDGEYHMGTSFMSDEDDELIIDQGSITEGEVINYVVSLDSSSEDSPITTELADTTPPTIEIFSPEDGKKYLNSGELEIDFEITDDNSGVASISATLDGRPVVDTEIVDLSLVGLGPHELVVNAEDNAGNSAESLVEFETFATLDSLLANLEHYFELGLIKGPAAYWNLRAKLQALPHILKTRGELQARATSAPWFLRRALQVGINNLNTSARNHFNNFIAQVRRGKDKTINSKAADLLIEQAQYLRDK